MNKTNSAKPYRTIFMAMALFGNASAGCALDDPMGGEDQELGSVRTELEAGSPERGMLGDLGSVEEPNPNSSESYVNEFPSLDVDATIAAFDRCSHGDICFFTERDGGGDMCSWFQFDQDWTSGATICSWSRTRNVKSVANYTSRRMQYYKEPNYVNRVGSTLSGVSGNLAGTYMLGSHRPQ